MAPLLSQFPEAHYQFIALSIKLFAEIGKYEHLCAQRNLTARPESSSCFFPRFEVKGNQPLTEDDVRDFLFKSDFRLHGLAKLISTQSVSFNIVSRMKIHPNRLYSLAHSGGTQSTSPEAQLSMVNHSSLQSTPLENQSKYSTTSLTRKIRLYLWRKGYSDLILPFPFNLFNLLPTTPVPTIPASQLVPITCRAKLENVVVVGSNKCVWVQLDSECCEFVSPKDRDPGSYNGE